MFQDVPRCSCTGKSVKAKSEWQLLSNWPVMADESHDISRKPFHHWTIQLPRHLPRQQEAYLELLQILLLRVAGSTILLHHSSPARLSLCLYRSDITHTSFKVRMDSTDAIKATQWGRLGLLKTEASRQ